jgi:hypothetical protein
MEEVFINTSFKGRVEEIVNEQRWNINKNKKEKRGFKVDRKMGENVVTRYICLARKFCLWFHILKFVYMCVYTHTHTHTRARACTQTNLNEEIDLPQP